MIEERQKEQDGEVREKTTRSDAGRGGEVGVFSPPIQSNMVKENPFRNCIGFEAELAMVGMSRCRGPRFGS